MRWAGNIAYMGEKRNSCRLLVGKSKEKRVLGRPKFRWENKINWILEN
jgi:hypothetical protein